MKRSVEESVRTMRGMGMGLIAVCVLAPLRAGHADHQVVGATSWAEAEGSIRWWEWEGATGDWGGVRTVVADRGIEVFGGYAAEVWGNTTGGLKRGTVYTGVLDFGANVDLEKFIGWAGASVSTTWLWLSGRDASEDLVGNFLTISNIAGFNTLRCYELWFQQNLLGGKISLRAGQLGADTEFVISDYAANFLNGTFGWPAFVYTSLPEGGPGWPVGTLGVRLALNPSEWLTFQAAVFQGNVFAQDVNRHGFRWRLDRAQGYTWLNEAQFRWNQADEATGLPGQFKMGAWFSSSPFADSFDGSPRWGDYGFYFILDQKLFSETEPVETPSAAKAAKSVVSPADARPLQPAARPGEQGLGAFTRFAFEPSDRNFLDFYFDAGLVYTGLIPGRDDDVLGAAIACGKLSRGAVRLFEGEGSIDPGYEIAIEFTYGAAITKWLTIQPDLQVILHPGGTRDTGNALVIGARATITF